MTSLPTPAVNTRAPVVRRGRPPRLSRDQIIEAVADMLERDPRSPMTMARAAQAVGASPMSLYRHFADRDDLVLAVTRHVLRGAATSIPSGAWQDRVREWMRTVYTQAIRHPQLFQLAASGESLLWLPGAAEVAEILQTGGFAPDRLAEAVFWVGSTTLGQALVASAAHEDVQLPRLHEAVGHLTPEEAARLGPLIPDFAALSTSGFDVVIDLAIAALTAIMPSASRRSRSRRAR